MAIVNRSFSVNVTPGMMPPIVHVSEYDVGRAYTVSILDEQGNTFTIPSGTTASIEGTLNGSVGFTKSATVSNNQVSFTLSQDMTAYSGKAWCKIKLTQNSQPIQTCAFVLAVDRAGVEADTVIGAPGFEEQIQEAVEDWLDEHGGITVDDTLSQQGEAADAKAVGDALEDIVGESISPTPTVDLASSFVYEEGKVIAADGTESSNTGSKIVDYFAVTPGTTYKFVFEAGSSSTANTRVHAYDASKQWVSQVALITSNSATEYTENIVVPSGVKFLRISMSKIHTIKEFSYTRGGGTGEHDNLTSLTARVEALEDSQVVIETDDTLSIEGAAADAKAVGDAIKAITDDTEEQFIELDNDGSVDGFVNNSGSLVTSTVTKAFYFAAEPGKKYVFKYSGTYDTNAHFIAEFSSVPAVGSVSTNFVYKSGGDITEVSITASQDARYIAVGHGTKKSFTDMQFGYVEYGDGFITMPQTVSMWELGSVSTQNGSKLNSTIRIRPVDFIKVSKGTTFSTNGQKYVYCFYSNPSTTAFVRSTSSFITADTIFDEDGYILVGVAPSDSSATTITPTMKENMVSQITVTAKRSEIWDRVRDELISDYIGNGGKKAKSILVGQPYAYLSDTIEDEILDSKTCDDLYEIYDGLCTEHPETFVRLPDIGAESTQNLPLRMYRMKWTTPFVVEQEASWDQSKNLYDSGYDKYRRLFISAGTHGNEKSSAYGVALAIKEIVESDAEFAKYIRANFAIDIVPIVNPAGFNATTRNNGANVNINRDFLTRNTAEAQAVYNVLTSNEYYACIDSHNSGGNANYIGIPNTNPRHADYIDIGMKFGQIMFNDWKTIATGEQYATSPYMQFWLHTPGAGMMQDLFTELGLVGWLIESVGVFASNVGVLTPNHKKYCKFTKDLLINSIICLGTNDWN